MTDFGEYCATPPDHGLGSRSAGSTVGTATAARKSLFRRAIGAVRTASIEQKILIILLCIFAAKGFAVALIHQPFTGHDEVMHYAYLSFVAEQHRMPVIPDLGQWQQDYNAKKGMDHDRAPNGFGNTVSSRLRIGRGQTRV